MHVDLSLGLVFAYLKDPSGCTQEGHPLKGTLSGLACFPLVPVLVRTTDNLGQEHKTVSLFSQPGDTTLTPPPITAKVDLHSKAFGGLASLIPPEMNPLGILLKYHLKPFF